MYSSFLSMQNEVNDSCRIPIVKNCTSLNKIPKTLYKLRPK